MFIYKLKTGGQVLLIPTEDIEPPEEYERTVTDPDELTALAQSIGTIGIINPVIVKSIGWGKYRIVAGERRRKAAAMVELDYIPALLIHDDENICHIYSIAENLHRSDVHFLDTSRRIEELRENYSLEDITDLLSIPEGQILSRIHLLSLPEHIKYRIISSGISEKDAVLISRVTDNEKREEITELMINEQLSFNEAAATVRKRDLKPVIRARYKDLTVFTNTLDHAINTMKLSGIDTNSEKTENENIIEYRITIKKLI